MGALQRGTPATGDPGKLPQWTAACSRVGDPSRALVTPCLGSIGIDALLAAVERGAEAVTLLHGNCSECQFERSIIAFRKRLPWIEAVLESSGLEAGSIRLEIARSTLSNPGRRDLFRGLFGGLRKGDPEERKPQNSSPPPGRGGNGRSVERELEDSPFLPKARVELG
ncbi:MAG: hydrogenase iron-sulfur subunit, partial [Planctomycetota bacterium]